MNLYGISQNHTQLPIVINKYIQGTLTDPGDSKNLVICIAGSGPVDRDGNQNFSKSSYLKKLTNELATDTIASFRFDKRVLRQIEQGRTDEAILFDDFVTDVQTIVGYFKNQGHYEHIYLLGHGQGALVGLLAITEDVKGFISINGSSKNIGDTIVEQVSQSAPELKEATTKVVNILRSGRTTVNYPQALANAFNIETQPFLISWMAYEPKVLIGELSIPGLLLHGSKDLQISPEEGKVLFQNCNTCEFILIENMNHMLFDIRGDELENYKSYSDPSFQISKELVMAITQFIHSN